MCATSGSYIRQAMLEMGHLRAQSAREQRPRGARIIGVMGSDRLRPLIWVASTG